MTAGDGSCRMPRRRAMTTNSRPGGARAFRTELEPGC
jgi:hypothetical protein